jgi:glutamate synthase (NADPH/NADH) large chain
MPGNGGSQGGGISRSSSLHVAAQAATAVETAVLEIAPLAEPAPTPWQRVERMRAVDTTVLAATGWNREHLQEIESLASEGKDLIGSLGHDGPLAVLSQNRVNVADFYKETVAVVTNPAIAWARNRGVLDPCGRRAACHRAEPRPEDLLVVLETPLLPGGHPDLGGEEIAREIANALGTLSIDELAGQFGSRAVWLTLGVYSGEDVSAALDRLANEAVDAVHSGAQCLVLDDFESIQSGLGWLDPHLATGTIDRALREIDAPANLRRRTGIVVRSASVRTLHDLALLCGFGADAVNPYAMLMVATGRNKSSTAVTDEQALVELQRQLLQTLTHGLEKVTSTIGCHELRGYGRVSSAIGLAPSLATMLRTPNFFGSEEVGLTWERLFNREAAERRAELCGEAKAQLARVDRFYPKFWKKAEAVAHGEMSLDEFIAEYRALSEEVPVTLRHTLAIKSLSDEINPDEVDLSIGHHRLPILISAMSFGSQGELSYRAYAESALQLDILCVNGEGGELPDMMDGRYKRHRGQQVASARFGVMPGS